MRCRTGARSKWKCDTKIYENTLAERSNGGGGGVCGYAYVCVCVEGWGRVSNGRLFAPGLNSDLLIQFRLFFSFEL